MKNGWLSTSRVCAQFDLSGLHASQCLVAQLGAKKLPPRYASCGAFNAKSKFDFGLGGVGHDSDSMHW